MENNSHRHTRNTATRTTTVIRCRACNRTFTGPPLLIYDNMPKSAQFLPQKDGLDTDKGVSLNIFQCTYCGLIQLSNDPVFYFREVIRAAGISPEIKKYRLNQFSDFIEKNNLSGKKCIEIGCGFGEYLELLDRCGTDTYGLEFSPHAVQHCLNNNLKVMRGFIDSADAHIENGPFSAFLILNFLEHLPEPVQTLMGIYNNLHDDALGIVEVPNVNMILEKALFSEFTTDHLLYFTKESLATTLSMSGFEVLNCQVIWHDYIISALVRKRRKPHLEHFNKQKEQLRHNLDAFLRDFHPDHVAVWGAGHQALAVMALFKLQGRIKCVIDSAPFKQNRFTPATHIEIVSPEYLNSHDIKAIIVMAASYSDEVIDVIQQNYDNRIKIAVLKDNALRIVSNPKEMEDI